MSDAELTVLACLPAMTPVRLRHLLRHHPPAEALAGLRDEASLSPMVERHIKPAGLADLRRHATAASADDLVASCASLGIEVVSAAHPDWGGAFDADPEAPAALFVRGDLAALRARRVGIVGTRNATTSGKASARELGRDLSACGIAVVSGLARGIDGAAHEGVREFVRISDLPHDGAVRPGRPVAVVGSGLDVPYPARHRELWEWVAHDGLLVSEYPPGAAPEAWHFPQRNRLIAALSEVLVVVESRERGGSLITAEFAIERGVDVMIVPGSTRSRASAGTNQLLFDGAGMVRSAADVLTQLGLDHGRTPTSRVDPRPHPTGLQATVLAVCRQQPSTLDMIVMAAGCSVADAALAAARLERSGWLVEAAGWFEPASSRLGGP